jgi:predicted exporter
MYLVLLASTFVFGWYGYKLQYEENIIKLLPRSSTDNEMAFSEIGLKDKVFLQLTSRDTLSPVGTARMGEAMEDFCKILEQKDSSTHYFTGIFCKLDADMGLSALDFALTHLPTFVDTSWYRELLPSLTREAIDAQMSENYRILEEDETGEASQMVAMDPLNLRERLLGSILGDGQTIGGVTMDNGHLFCPDKTVALAYIAPAFSGLDSGTGTRMVNMINRTAREYEAANPDIRILFHGTPVESVSNASTIKHDLIWTIGLSLLLILIIMLMSFHKFSFIWQQVVPVVYGSFFALACMYWIKGVMSFMALGLSAIVLGVAISYCLHMLIHYYYVGDTEKLLRDESTPVFLGCITTVGAFMGLIFTESELLRDFGLFATFALIGNTFFALVFLPHFLHPGQIKFKRTHGFPLVERINNLPWDRNKWIIGTLLVLIVIGIAMSPRVKFDSDLSHLDYDNEALRESVALYNNKNTSDSGIQVFFAAWDNEILDNALEYNKGMRYTLDSLVGTGLVKGYSPVSHLLFQSQADQKLRIEAWKEFWNAERVQQLRKDLTASAREYALPDGFFDTFLGMLTSHYETGDLFASGLVPPGLMSNFVEQQADGRYLVFTEVSFDKEDANQVMREVTKAPHVFVLEPFFYCRDMVEIVHDDFNTTLWISSLFVLIVLLVSFRNIWISLLAFLPMFVSWYVMQGYMALFGLEFNLINIVISTFIYGIGVDYSIFVMEGLLSEARNGEKSMLEYHKVAIFYSAMVLAIVTFSLIFARHPAIHSIGLITLIGMASTILITYSLQPWVFRLLTRVPFFRRGFRIPEK